MIPFLKKFVNSTIGTSQMKPLDELISDRSFSEEVQLLNALNLYGENVDCEPIVFLKLIESQWGNLSAENKFDILKYAIRIKSIELFNAIKSKDIAMAEDVIYNNLFNFFMNADYKKNASFEEVIESLLIRAGEAKDYAKISGIYKSKMLSGFFNSSEEEAKKARVADIIVNSNELLTVFMVDRYALQLPYIAARIAQSGDLLFSKYSLPSKPTYINLQNSSTVLKNLYMTGEQSNMEDVPWDYEFYTPGSYYMSLTTIENTVNQLQFLSKVTHARESYTSPFDDYSFEYELRMITQPMSFSSGRVTKTGTVALPSVVDKWCLGYPAVKMRIIRNQEGALPSANFSNTVAGYLHRTKTITFSKWW